MQLHGDGDERAAFGGEIGIELGEGVGCCTGRGSHGAACGFAKLRLKTANNRYDTGAAAEVAQEILAARSLGEGE